ncbi:MAG: OmpA family protein [Cyclobacteriaceae bacterium]|nr:OmpA family protein [Cyclobacteriaceae bacterium]
MRSWVLVLSTLLFAVLTTYGQQDELRKSIYFGGGSYFIDDFQAQELFNWLDSVPNLLEKYEIHLISHTDPIGGREYNEWLSEMRSGAVQDLLILRNIPEHKISVKDWGLENPVFRNDSRRGMSLNRRVDVILYPLIF